MTGAPISADVWIWPLDVASPAHWLSEDETARAARFVTDTLQQRWAASRAGMRGILGQLLERPPESFVFGAGEHGRPFLQDKECPYSFNLSHSEGLAALVICEAVAGVDIERVRPLHQDVADMFFSPAENEALDSLGEDGRAEGFYRCWTAKEAVLKALGSGLSISGKSFTVDFTGPAAPVLVEANWKDREMGDWQLAAFEPEAGFAGAVAARTSRSLRVTLKRWEFPG